MFPVFLHWSGIIVFYREYIDFLTQLYVNGEKDVKLLLFFLLCIYMYMFVKPFSDNILGTISDSITGVYINRVFKRYLILVLLRKEITGKKLPLSIISNLPADIYKDVIRCTDLMYEVNVRGSSRDTLRHRFIYLFCGMSFILPVKVYKEVNIMVYMQEMYVMYPYIKWSRSPSIHFNKSHFISNSVPC